MSTNHTVYRPKLEHIREIGHVLLTVTQLLSQACCHPIVLWANWVKNTLYSLLVTSCYQFVFPLWHWRRREQYGAQTEGRSHCNTSEIAHNGHRSGDIAKKSVFGVSELSAQGHVFSNVIITELQPRLHAVDLLAYSMLYRWQRPSLASECGLSHPTSRYWHPFCHRRGPILTSLWVESFMLLLLEPFALDLQTHSSFLYLKNDNQVVVPWFLPI